MKQVKTTKLYNILLPIWLLVFIPSWLWLILVPANYLIDRVVLKWSLGDMPEKGLFCRKHTWKICLVGFFSDFVGAIAMLGVYFIGAMVADDSPMDPLMDKLEQGVGFNPFDNLPSFIVVVLAIALAGIIIYLLDRLILKKCGLDAAQAKKSALRMALITAPYLFLLPSGVIYNNMSIGF